MIFDERGRTMLGERGTKIVVLNVAANPVSVEEIEALDVGHHFGQRLGERGDIQRRMRVPHIVEEQLLREDGLPCPGLTHHDINGIAWKTTAEDLVRLWI